MLFLTKYFFLDNFHVFSYIFLVFCYFFLAFFISRFALVLFCLSVPSFPGVTSSKKSFIHFEWKLPFKIFDSKTEKMTKRIHFLFKFKNKPTSLQHYYFFHIITTLWYHCQTANVTTFLYIQVSSTHLSNNILCAVLTNIYQIQC